MTEIKNVTKYQENEFLRFYNFFFFGFVLDNIITKGWLIFFPFSVCVLVNAKICFHVKHLFKYLFIIVFKNYDACVLFFFNSSQPVEAT